MPTGGDGQGGAPAGNVDGGQGAGGAPAADWTASLSEETRGFVANRKWGSPEDIVKSYRNLESLRGVPEDRLLKLPEGDDQEAWSHVYERLGRPSDPNQYELAVAETTSDEVKTWLRNTMHQAGLTTQQAKALSQAMAERTQTKAAERQALAESAVNDDLATLRKEWGAAYEQNWQAVDRAAATLGLEEKQLAALKDAWGPAQAARFLHGLNEKLGEDTFAGGSGGGAPFGAMPPAQAAARIGDLKADPGFRKRLMDGDKAATDQWHQLHRWAYGNHG